MGPNLQTKASQVFGLKVLAYTIQELFPDAIFWPGSATHIDFALEFAIKSPLNESFIPYIEEAFRKNLKMPPKWQTIEMMRENAAELFRHKGQLEKADEVLLLEDNVVSLLKFENFLDIKPSGFFEPSGLVPKIFSLKPDLINDLTGIRLEGALFPNQQALKEGVKRRARAKDFRHQELGSKLGLFRIEEKGVLFFPRGEILKTLIVKRLEDLTLEMGILPVSHSELLTSSDISLLKRLDSFGVSEWLIEPLPSSQNNQGLFDLPIANCFKMWPFLQSGAIEEIYISSLQFIAKTIKMFDLPYEWVLCDSRPKSMSAKQWKPCLAALSSAAQKAQIPYLVDSEPGNYPHLELRVFDAYGHPWTMSEVGREVQSGGKGNEGKEAEKRVCEEIVIIRSLERLIGLLIEKNAGQFPYWLAPEQVRILPIAKANEKRAKEIQQICKESGLRVGIDLGNEKLADKVHLSIQHKVPYVLVIGAEEERVKKVALRRLGDEHSSNLRLEEFITIAAKENNSSS